MSNICKKIKNDIENMYERSQKDEDYYPTLRASQIGDECSRKLWYRLRWALKPKKWSGRMIRLFETGKKEEDRIIQNLKDAGFDVLFQQKEILPLSNSSLTGSIDGQIPLTIREGEQEFYLIEIKTHNDINWKSWNRYGVEISHPKHFGQICTYLTGLDLKKCIYISLNKNTDEIGFEEINKDDEKCKKILKKASDIVYSEDIPLRILDKKNLWMCKLCEFNNICYEEDLPRKNCRTCINFEFDSSGTFGKHKCNKFSTDLSLDQQKQGCSSHIYNPKMINAKQINFNKKEESVTYKLKNGKTFKNCIKGDIYE